MDIRIFLMNTSNRIMRITSITKLTIPIRVEKKWWQLRQFQSQVNFENTFLTQINMFYLNVLGTMCVDTCHILWKRWFLILMDSYSAYYKPEQWSTPLTQYKPCLFLVLIPWSISIEEISEWVSKAATLGCEIFCGVQEILHCTSID